MDLGVLAVLAACCGAAMAAEVNVTECAILMQFEDERGFLADSMGVHPLGEAAPGASQAQGKFGSGCKLASDQGWVDAGTNFGLRFCMPQQTISVWVLPDEAAGAPEEGRFVLGCREAPERSSWRWNLVIFSGGRPGFAIYDGQQDPPSVVLRGDQPLPSDSWSHLAAVIDTVGDKRVTLYVNGEPVASHDLFTNAPYGHLFIGAAPPHNFTGTVDELAIFERALDPDEVRALAAAKAPLQAAGAAGHPQGFRVKPIRGRHQIMVAHSAVPRTRWMLRIPEHSYPKPEGEGYAIASDVAWERDEDTGQWRLHWDADEATKQQAMLDFHGTVTVQGNVIDFALTIENVGETAWEKPRMTLFCLMAPESPDFVDYEAERTYVCRGGEWVTMGEVVNHEFADHRMCGIRVGDGPEEASRLAAKLSVDGKYLHAIATDIAASLSFNFQTRTNCIHSNPGWDLLEPGQEQTATGKVYFLEGTLDELYEMYLRDFADEDDAQ